jgi:L-fuculose-phosphate aldolase
MSTLQNISKDLEVNSAKESSLAGREAQLRDELVEFGHHLRAEGFIVATDGNLSARLDSQRIIITPAGADKAKMKPADMIVVNEKGQKLAGWGQPSSEGAMHITIYNMRPDVGAIIHAHPCTATAFASVGIAFDEPLCPEVVLTLGSVPLAPYATPGTSELSESLKPFIRDHQAILMGNHGVVTFANDLVHAYRCMETVEHYAKIEFVSRQLGGQRLLSPSELKQLRKTKFAHQDSSTM